MVQKQHAMAKVVAVVLGAGQGTRMGQSINKIFLPIHGKPIIVYAIGAFEQCPAIDEILLVAAVGEEEQLAKLAQNAHCRKVQHVIHGGATRHTSEQCALEVLRPRISAGEIDIVLIHDGARPFISTEQIAQLVLKARELGGAILATPLQAEELIVQVDGALVIQKSFEGEQVWRAQTPQAFRASLLLNAYDQAEKDQFFGTDTSASVERLGGSVAVIQSEATNLKITTSHDLFLAEKLERYRHE